MYLQPKAQGIVTTHEEPESEALTTSILAAIDNSTGVDIINPHALHAILNEDNDLLNYKIQGDIAGVNKVALGSFLYPRSTLIMNNLQFFCEIQGSLYMQNGFDKVYLRALIGRKQDATVVATTAAAANQLDYFTELPLKVYKLGAYTCNFMCKTDVFARLDVLGETVEDSDLPFCLAFVVANFDATANPAIGHLTMAFKSNTITEMSYDPLRG